MRRLLSLTLATALFFLSSCEKGPSHIYKEPLFEGNNYFIDIKGLKEGQPEFYEVKSDNKQVSFFVILANGSLKSYLNACRQCYPQKMGYRYENGYIICRYCNKKYPLDVLEEGAGNCYPIRLPGTAVGNKYVIDKEQLMSAAKYF